MIIVLTNQGPVFVNEKEYRTVSHNRDQEVVIAKRKKIYPENVAKIDGDAEIIEKVISVHYYSDSEPVKFHDESNELKKAKEDYSKLLEQFKELRKEKFGADTDIIALSNQVDALKVLLAKSKFPKVRSFTSHHLMPVLRLNRKAFLTCIFSLG